MESVYSAVRTGPLNDEVCAPSFKGYRSPLLHDTETTVAQTIYTAVFWVMTPLGHLVSLLLYTQRQYVPPKRR
jgi:hypothetical protein